MGSACNGVWELPRLSSAIRHRRCWFDRSFETSDAVKYLEHTCLGSKYGLRKGTSKMLKQSLWNNDCQN
jgi:hypothetical protein